MAFNVTYSFNNGATTGTATSITALRTAIYNYAHSGSISSSTGSDYSHLTQCTLSGTIEGDIGFIAGVQNGLFDGCNSLTSIDLSNLDTSNVTGMRSMFYDCNSLTSIDLSNLDTSNVKSMRSMFYDCNSLTSIDLSNLDTSNVEDMHYMFYNCPNLEHIYVSNTFVTTQVTSSDGMFTSCIKLPNFNSSYTDKTKAFIGEGGYLEKAPSYSIQLKHNTYNAFPKVAVDGTTIVDNNGVLSATAQTPSIATTSTAGIVKPDGTTINVTADGTISASQYTLPQATTNTLGGVKVDGTTIVSNNGVISASSSSNVEAIKESEFTTTYKSNMQNGSIAIVVKNI